MEEIVDKKEELILKHYGTLLENKKFDEYDILGFLIVVRRLITRGEFPNIHEFSDLIAHRERNKGIVRESIEKAKKNGYKTYENSKEVQGYDGIKNNEWLSEWKKLGKEVGINLSDDIIKDITLCIFSIAQFTKYYIDKDCKGSLELFLFEESIALASKDSGKHSPYITYAIIEGYNPCRKDSTGLIQTPVETIRDKEGILRLKDSEGYLI